MKSYISRECDYAIRITSYLAGLKTKSQMSVSEISGNLQISKSYAARIIHTLKNAKILKTTQGLYGGISLAKDANEISLFDVLKAMKFNFTVSECLGKRGICSFPSFCKVHTYLYEVEKNLLEQFKNAKISEFAFDEQLINKLNKLN